MHGCCLCGSRIRNHLFLGTLSTGTNKWRIEAVRKTGKGRAFPGSVRNSGCYPVHLQQYTGLSFLISKVGVGKARAQTQGGPPEGTNFLCHLTAVLHIILSRNALLVVLLHRIVVSWCRDRDGLRYSVFRYLARVSGKRSERGRVVFILLQLAFNLFNLSMH